MHCQAKVCRFESLFNTMPFPWLETPSDYELPLTPRAQAIFTCRARDLRPSLRMARCDMHDDSRTGFTAEAIP